MRRSLEQELRAQAQAEAVAQSSSSTTTRTARAAGTVRDTARVIPLFDGVSEALRLRLELVAAASPERDAALVAVVDQLVEGDSRKRAAIVDAITTNDALQAQWQHAWLQLRS